MNDPSADELLERYQALLHAWAPRLDLIAPTDLRRLRERHIDDSLRLLPVLDETPAGYAIDVGSGAGLPGIPLAVAGPRSVTWRLLEPRRRRAAFLEEVVRELCLDCEVIVDTAEAAARDPRLRAAHVLATARGLAPPIEAFRLLKPLVARGGRAVVFLGKGAEVPEGTGGEASGLAIMKRKDDAS